MQAHKTIALAYLSLPSPPPPPPLSPCFYTDVICCNYRSCGSQGNCKVRQQLQHAPEIFVLLRRSQFRSFSLHARARHYTFVPGKVSLLSFHIFLLFITDDVRSSNVRCLNERARIRLSQMRVAIQVDSESTRAVRLARARLVRDEKCRVFHAHAVIGIRIRRTAGYI